MKKKNIKQKEIENKNYWIIQNDNRKKERKKERKNENNGKREKEKGW